MIHTRTDKNQRSADGSGQCADQRSARRRDLVGIAAVCDDAGYGLGFSRDHQQYPGAAVSQRRHVRACADGMGRFIVFAQTGKRLIRTGVMKNGQLLHGEAAHILCDGGRPVRIGRCHLAPDGAHPFRSDDRAWRRAERPAACPPCPSVLRRC